MIDTGYKEVGIALVLMLIAIILVRWQKVGTEKELAIGTIRSFIQLVAVGYALEFIFDLENIFAIAATIMVMIVVGSHTASRRAPHIPKVWMNSFAAILAGSIVTLGLMLAVGIIRAKAQYIIPLGGMVVGNSMNTAALVMERLHSEITGNRLAVETSLSLGKTWRQAVIDYFSKSVKAGLMSMLNFFKVVGIVQLPGAMTGMILAGASPLKAVLIQVIVGYMITAAATVTGLVAAHLSVRNMFTKDHQLKI
jgi:putative ABC transport system permease protein